MCLKRRLKNKDRRPKTLWSKMKTHQSKLNLFSLRERGKDCKHDKLDSYFISVGTTRVKLRKAVIFQQKYRNIICHDDLVYFVLTNILFFKCISENCDEVTLLPCYILSILIILKCKCQLCVTQKFIHHVQRERLTHLCSVYMKMSHERATNLIVTKYRHENLRLQSFPLSLMEKRF